MLPDDSVLSQSFKQAGWDVALSLDTNHLQNPFFFAVAVGLLLEGRVALLNLPPLDAAILVKLVQSQQRVKVYSICIQSQSTASFVWAQADVQCLLEKAHRIARPTCLDGAPWSQNNEIVSNHYSILSLEGICSHKFHSEMSPSVNFGNFVASSSWQRFSHKMAGVWNWAQHMTLERSSVHLAGMLSPPGQSFFTEHTFFPRVPDQSVTWQEEWGRLSSQFGGRFLHSFRKGWAQFFMLLWLETLSTLFFVLQL